LGSPARTTLPPLASAVAVLLFLLNGRVANRLECERDPDTGDVWEASDSPYTPEAFWAQAVGVVTPHRAQQGLIVSHLHRLFGDTGVPATAIRAAVDTVERFQGQQRDIIIASFALGDPDAIHEEDEFLMSLNRFNVMASRARAKLIVLVSQEVVDHLSSDLDTMRASVLLKTFVESFCRSPRPMTLGVIENGVQREINGLLKQR
jgi:DNA replication ATP-dependent helicase Dna2